MMPVSRVNGQPKIKARVLIAVGKWQERHENRLTIPLPKDVYDYIAYDQGRKHRMEKTLIAATVLTYFARCGKDLTEILQEIERRKKL